MNIIKLSNYWKANKKQILLNWKQDHIQIKYLKDKDHFIKSQIDYIENLIDKNQLLPDRKLFNLEIELWADLQ